MFMVVIKMTNCYRFKTKQNLEVIYVEKKGFIKGFCGIGCRYGGNNIEFIYNNKKYRSSYGIAHFLEHKLFLMPDNSDAFKMFSKMNAIANAYTASDKTIYYFSINDDIYKPLKLLLDMYFTPYFPKKEVEKEKPIICSEIKMYNDTISYRISQECLRLLYPNDDYSYSITANIDDVNNITKEELEFIYNAFYTPDNSILCVVGDYDKDKLFSFIQQVMDSYQCSNKTALKLNTIKSKNVLKPEKLEIKSSQSEAVVLLRIDDITNKDKNSCEMILAIIDALLNVSSNFYKMLEDKKLFDNDFDYQVVTSDSSSYVMIFASSKHPKSLAKAIINKLNNLDVNDIEKRLVDLYLKHLKANQLLEEDSIDTLGENVLSLALEDIDYFTSQVELLNLTYDDILKYLPKIRDSLKTFAEIDK